MFVFAGKPIYTIVDFMPKFSLLSWKIFCTTKLTVSTEYKHLKCFLVQINLSLSTIQMPILMLVLMWITSTSGITCLWMCYSLVGIWLKYVILSDWELRSETWMFSKQLMTKLCTELTYLTENPCNKYYSISVVMSLCNLQEIFLIYLKEGIVYSKISPLWNWVLFLAHKVPYLANMNPGLYSVKDKQKWLTWLIQMHNISLQIP